MELRYHLPRIDLRDYVRAYYYYATDTPSVQPLCAELGNIRILIDGAGSLQMPDGDRQHITSAFLIGPTMGAYSMDAKAGTRVFGVGIHPRGWAALLGVDAWETTNKVYDLTDFAGRVAGSTIEEIRNAASFAEMTAAADRFFAHLYQSRVQRTCAYPQALDRWLASPDDFDLDQLIEMMDISRRQTDRVAKRFFGASPKVLQRKYRALRAADRIRAGETRWLAAANTAFYDQSHFIKEFRTFIGVTPGQFINNQAQLISVVQEKRCIKTTRHTLSTI